MLRSYERGFAVMNKDLTAYSFESQSLETYKRYCRNDDVIVERLPYVYGKSIRITWHKYWDKPIKFKKRHREANIFYLHISWNNEYTHKIGQIIHKN